MNPRVEWFPGFVAGFRLHAVVLRPEPDTWIGNTPILWALCGAYTSAKAHDSVGERCVDCLHRLAKLSTPDSPPPAYDGSSVACAHVSDDTWFGAGGSAYQSFTGDLETARPWK